MYISYKKNHKTYFGPKCIRLEAYKRFLDSLFNIGRQYNIYIHILI